MKRRVQNPDLGSNFVWQRRYYYFKNNFLLNDHVFNVFTFFVFVICMSLILGMFVRIFWSLSLALSSYMLYAWFRTKKQAYGITLRRNCEKRGRESSLFQIHYDISNESGFPLPPFSFSQPFEGVQKGMIEVKVPGIPAQTRVRVTSEVKLDAGMGVKEMGDITVLVHDELSLFPYRVEFSGTEEIEVFPLILETPQLRKSISPDSTEFGFFDIQKRGESNLFIGTREYRHGDPVKHINWKLSQKTQNLIINEFEKNTNTYVTLLLDLELNSQVGIGAISTWEAAKDLALSIAFNEVKYRNYIQVLAQDLYIPFGTGPEQLTTIERHFTYHEMAKSGLSHLTHLQELPSGSQVYFFCPLLTTNNVMETLSVLKRLKHMGQSVTVIGLDPYQEIRKTVSREVHTPFLVAGKESQIKFKEIEKDLRSNGIDFVRIEIGEGFPLRDMIRINAGHLIDEGPQ